MTLRILLADDHAIVRQGLRVLLEREGFAIVGEATDGREAVQMAHETKPDVAVLDLMMPHLNGLDAAREILRDGHTRGVVLLTMHTEEHQVASALRAGVRAYVLKSQAAEDLVRAIHDVHRGKIFLSPVVSSVVVNGYLSGQKAPGDRLAPRERQVLQLVAEGKTSKEIAGMLGVSVKTAESYRAHLMEKLDIHDTAGLVRYAIRQGLIVP
jgi:two-component system, NarL family, response regulator NreC